VHFSACIDRLKSTGLLVEAWDPSACHIDRLAIDSREVGPSDCFVALRGASTDGHLFIDKAVKNGAVAIVSEAGPEPATFSRTAGPAFAHVSDSHRALAELSSLYHGDPGQDLDIFAVTGTNGKTTVATLIAHVLKATGNETGFIGTTGYRFGHTVAEATHTTPSSIQLYGLLDQMKKAGCSTCSMEASSHAIDQVRMRPSDVDVAVFTNLSRDHLDYHGTFEAYGSSKKRLFDQLNSTGHAVTNLDDAAGRYMVSDCPAPVLTFGQGKDADIRYTIRANELSGLVVELDGVTQKVQLTGAFNASNLAAAYSACLAWGLDANLIREGLADCPPVRGRMETFQLENGSTVIVDYAHTPDALQNVLSTVRESLPSGTSLWCILGCGGDRDRGKRPEMGAIAEKWADNVVVTSDNPRTERPEAIMEDIRAGMRSPENALWVVDRRLAIVEAAGKMRDGDTLVLAGKGHETYQVNGTERIHFDDREEAEKAFSVLGHRATQHLTV
jgi:UDP-N-acetylmuramoyl-L-alanyl-D-glutamate--2,6-diaminopimelate ligase